AFVLGVWLGTSNVALVAFAQEHGSPGFGGVLIGLTVLSGSVCGLTYGGITWKVDVVQRLLWIGLVLGLGSLPLLAAHSLWLMAPLALVAGMAISPMLITLYSMLGNLVPKSSITEGFAWFASVITFGISACAWSRRRFVRAMPRVGRAASSAARSAARAASRSASTTSETSPHVCASAAVSRRPDVSHSSARA